MSGATEKSLAVLEFLADHPDGASLATIATQLDQLRSGCHRTLNELIRFGYVRQIAPRGTYVLTTKLASMGLSFLSKSGIVDIAQPLLDDLARETEELVRLAIVDGARLTLVARSQGAKAGLRYDPDMGIELKLSCSAAGHAWLATLADQQVITAVIRQGIGEPANFGPNAPTTVQALLEMLAVHRKRGFSMIRDVYAPGMSSMAAAVRRRGEVATGILVVAGPSIRLTEERMLTFGPALTRAAGELAVLGRASPLLKSTEMGTWGNRLR